ncbi:hypothetical protein WA158_001815 [Blastocystis sp. Blastoise]
MRIEKEPRELQVNDNIKNDWNKLVNSYCDFILSSKETNRQSLSVPDYLSFVDSDLKPLLETQFKYLSDQLSSDARLQESGAFCDSFLNSISYVYDTYKKGVIVSINTSNKKGMYYQPFSNSDFSNNWGEQLKFNNIQLYTSYKRKFDNAPLQCIYSILPAEKWVYNGNYIYMHESYQFDGYIDYCYYEKLFEVFYNYLLNHNISLSISLILNSFQFPLIYNTTLQSECSLPSFQKQPSFSVYLPILGSYTSSPFTDLPLPLYMDYILTFQPSFMPSRSLFLSSVYEAIHVSQDSDAHSVDQRSNCLFWRGDLSYNSGIKTIYQDLLTMKEELSLDMKYTDGIDAFEVTSNPDNPKTYKFQYYLLDEKVSIPLLKNKKGDYPNIFKTLSQCKYALVLPGPPSSCYLSLYAITNTLIIMSPEVHTWITPLLKPYIHYIPLINESIIDTISYINTHQQDIPAIIHNMKQLITICCTSSYMYNYMHSLCTLIQSLPCVSMFNNTLQESSDLFSQNNRYYSLKYPFSYPISFSDHLECTCVRCKEMCPPKSNQIKRTYNQ